ncbi:MAG: glycine cleavage system aminomethyltransferase GcvT, partial [Nitriliruptoraceae bacterium]
MTTTPLNDVHVELGAVLTDFAGWSMPLRYGSELAEHHAVRRAAGLFDLSHMGEIVVTGAAAGDVVDTAFVTRLSGIDVGRARYTMLCNPDGGVIDDVIVYRRADQDFLVVANAGNRARVFDELVERADGRAEVSDRSADIALIAVQGPRAAALVGSLGVDDVDAVRYYAGQDARVADVPVFLARTGYTGEDGFELFCASGAAVDLWNRIADAGAGAGLVPAGLACRDTLRLEAGMPLYGNEL